MKFFIFYLLFISTTFFGFSQNMTIANSYYEQGKFEEALATYEQIYNQNKGSSQAILGLAKTYRQLKRFEDAISILKKGLEINPERLIFSMEIGVTYHLNEETEKAQESFEKTIELVRQNPTQASYIGHSFQKYNLLKPAIECYKISIEENPNPNYNEIIGQMYGELGDFGNMFSYYLDFMLAKPAYIGHIQRRRLNDFITEDPENDANIIFRKVLLKKNQDNPDVLYNELLSWLFTQQKQFRKAFLQEKAIYKITDEGIPQIISLGLTAKEAKDYETAEEILQFVVENTDIEVFKLKAENELMRIKTQTYPKKQYATINKEYLDLIEKYGKERNNLEILLDYARFLGFKQDNRQEAIKFLKPLLKKDFFGIQKAQIEVLLGDILVLDNKFNQALIYYSRAQKKAKDNPVAQEARFKTAKASYYKGDFDWAKTQLNVLKSATTQLIANDAMELALLIDDNTKEDSIFTALKKFAKAELYTFQEKNDEALNEYDELLNEFAGNSIEDDALFKQAQLYYKLGQPEKAIANYEKLIRLYPTSLRIDDTYFELAIIYLSQENEEKAKALFEKIIFNHADSIHYVEARKKYRKLRGDAIVN